MAVLSLVNTHCHVRYEWRVDIIKNYMCTHKNVCAGDAAMYNMAFCRVCTVYMRHNRSQSWSAPNSVGGDCHTVVVGYTGISEFDFLMVMMMQMMTTTVTATAIRAPTAIPAICPPLRTVAEDVATTVGIDVCDTFTFAVFTAEFCVAA